MLKILFFASLRERLGTEGTSLSSERAKTVADVRAALIQDQPEWAETLQESRLLVAVNQGMAKDQTPVSSGDEIAFFPPVTGG